MFLLIFHCYKPKIENNAWFRDPEKWSEAVRCEERFTKPSKISDDECVSSSEETDLAELKDDTNIIQKHEDIIKNIKEKYYFA